MKNLSLLFIAFLLIQLNTLAQDWLQNKLKSQFYLKLASHDPNIKELPEKSFYESKLDWQYIIDTTWGPGLPFEQKQQICKAHS